MGCISLISIWVGNILLYARREMSVKNTSIAVVSYFLSRHALYLAVGLLLILLSNNVSAQTESCIERIVVFGREEIKKTDFLFLPSKYCKNCVKGHRKFGWLPGPSKRQSTEQSEIYEIYKRRILSSSATYFGVDEWSNNTLYSIPYSEALSKIKKKYPAKIFYIFWRGEETLSDLVKDGIVDALVVELMTFRSQKHRDKKSPTIGQRTFSSRVKLAQAQSIPVIPLLGMFFNGYAKTQPTEVELVDLVNSVKALAESAKMYAVYNNEDTKTLDKIHELMNEGC